MGNKEDWEIHWQDYYKTLRVSPSAEPEAIAAAYRALAKKYHPDINKDLSASERMKDINIAYEILSDPVKRKSYDDKWQQKRVASKPAASRPATGQFTTAAPVSSRTRRFHSWGIVRNAIKVGAIITVVAVLYLKVNACTHKYENDVARYQQGAPYTVVETVQIGGNVTAGPIEIILDNSANLGWGGNSVGISAYYLGDRWLFSPLPARIVNASTNDKFKAFNVTIDATALSHNASKIGIKVVANNISSH